jgi:serine/threonine protein kinase
MLTDFGLAKTDIENEDTKSFCGTPAYMAPEVVNKKLYNRSVDWY